jgi:hypothetical protein
MFEVTEEDAPMLYALLCYNDEDMVFSWSKAEDDAVMARLGVVHQRLAQQGKLGPSLRLMPTTAATTLRKDTDPPLVLDGPFAETKEALLGFYIVDCDSLDEAIGITRDLAKANPGGAYEIRPLRLYLPGSDVSQRAVAASEA